MAPALRLLALTLAASACAAPPELTYPTYSEVVARLHALAARAPDLVEVFSAQARWGVPSPGDCGGGVPCEHWLVRVGGRAPPPAAGGAVAACEAGARGASGACALAGARAPRARPQVFLSGNLHGDEVVGPLTLLFALEDLVAGAARGHPWLARLAATRTVVALPLTNPLGYVRGERGEHGVDTNRDFPYGAVRGACMRSAAARAVNEAWRAHAFTLALTFHGGMRSISYEWGAPNHAADGSRSPDDASQRAVGLVLREAAGALADGARYPVDRTNTLVYPVDGGMEDWAYAGSWEPDAAAVAPCAPDTYADFPYPASRTTYGPAVLRALNMLVEAADAKRPAEAALGAHADPAADAAWAGASPGSLAAVLAVEGPGDGHVPRNVRLVLAAVDLAQPYVVPTRWQASPLLAPAAAAGGAAPAPAAAGGAAPPPPPPLLRAPACAGGACDHLRADFAAAGGWLELPADAAGAEVRLGWDVGGGIAVDETAALLGAWDARVPPSFFDAPVGELLLTPEQAAAGAAAALAPATLPADALAALAAAGLPPDEAAAFARRVRAWQLLAAGQLRAADLPADAALWRSPPAAGATRWAFGGGAPVPPPAPAAELPSAAVPGAGADTANAQSPVPGAPDLARHPFVTRFAACVRLPAPGGAGAGAADPAADCAAPPPARAPPPRAAAAAAAYIFLPYAAVDGAWAHAEQPATPAGMPPQGHLANARTNAAWRMENEDGRVAVLGRLLAVPDRPLFLALAVRAHGEPPPPAPTPPPPLPPPPPPAAPARSRGDAGGGAGAHAAGRLGLGARTDAAANAAATLSSLAALGAGVIVVAAASFVAVRLRNLDFPASPTAAARRLRRAVAAHAAPRRRPRPAPSAAAAAATTAAASAFAQPALQRV
jgi:hypothetical protein